MLSLFVPTLLVGLFLSEILMSDEDDDDQDSTQGSNGSDGQGGGSSPQAGGFISGTNGDDMLRGDDGDDRILGAGGNDEIYGEGGNDIVGPGPQDDRVFLGPGNDSAVTDMEGNDTIAGGIGNDIISDTRGANILLGEEGDDRLLATDTGRGFTPDTLDGGDGDDTLIADLGDTLTGGAGADDFEVRFHPLAEVTARITDAEPGEIIRIVVPEAFEDEALTTRSIPGGTEVAFRGQALVVLDGITDISTVDLRFSADMVTQNA